MAKLSCTPCMSFKHKNIKLDTPKEQQFVSTRTTRPAHFLFKIDSFTKLEEILRESYDVENYESPEFECSGHKWKLSLYPKGNKKLGGDGYLSLYLVSAEVGIDSLASDGIYATFKLFIFDQIRENYLTIHDDEVRKFHSLRKEWGFTRLISRNAFKNVENGFLVDDCCVFGVEILVIPTVVKSASFSLIKPPKGGRFIWKIDNLSSLCDKIYYSEPFEVLDYQWKLLLRPIQGGNDFLLYLVLHESNDCSKVYVECSLKIEVEGHAHCFVNKYGWADKNHNLCIQDGTMLRVLSLTSTEDLKSAIIFKEPITVEVTINILSKFTTT